MGNNSANPTALGYMMVAITGWLFSMVSAGWFGQTIPDIGLVMGVYGGGLAAFVVGILLYLRGRQLDTMVLLGLGAFFFVVGTANLSADAAPAAESGYSAWFDLLWAAYFLMLWLSGRNGDATRAWFLLALGLTLLAHGLAFWIAPVLIMIGGYLGLITSLLGVWIAYGELSSSMGSGGATSAGMA